MKPRTVLLLLLVLLGVATLVAADPTIQSSKREQLLWESWQTAEAIVVTTLVDTLSHTPPSAPNPFAEGTYRFEATVDSLLAGSLPDTFWLDVRYQRQRPLSFLHPGGRYVLPLRHCGDHWLIHGLGHASEIQSDSVALANGTPVPLHVMIDSILVVREACSLEAQVAMSDAAVSGSVLNVDEIRSPYLPGNLFRSRADLSILVESVLEQNAGPAIVSSIPLVVRVPERVGARPLLRPGDSGVFFVTFNDPDWILNPSPFAAWQHFGADSLAVLGLSGCSPGTRSPIHVLSVFDVATSVQGR